MGISGRSRQSATRHTTTTPSLRAHVAELGLPPGVKREEVLKAMGGHVLAEGEIVGTYVRQESEATAE